ncbi:reverse transcriptase domain-containing protein [Tanacetum coccineum]
MKIQAGVQVSRPGKLRRHLQLWKCFGRLYFFVIVLDRNIVKRQRLEKKQVIKEEPVEKGKEIDYETVEFNTTEEVLGNMEMFAWEPANMIGVPRQVIKHTLNVNPSIKPICQKQRIIAPEKRELVVKEVAEWVKADIIRPNLNSACPKDYYPLPNIDCKVESVIGFKYKCFLDTYKGYHHIQMAREDEEKTAFYTDQRTRNLEAYVDDMVIKSNDEKALLADVVETFDNLRKINMKLNPKKCSFGVEEERDDTERWTLFTDEASSLKGSCADLVLIGPSDVEYTYALRLTFTSTNNEAEYEALLAGLRIARKMKIRCLKVKVDSKLMASQINRDYVASSDNMIKYLAKAKEYITDFESFSIKNIVLCKLALVAFNHLTKEILVECLENGVWPKDKNEAHNLLVKINQCVLEDKVLFKKGYLVPMLRCVGPLQANYVIQEIHMGVCGMHSGPRAVVRKPMRHGYYWPTMHEDAKEEIQKCDSCQIHSSVPKLPKTLMTSIMAPWPFYQ